MIIIFDDDESPIFKLKYDQKDLFKIYIYNSVINNNNKEEEKVSLTYMIYIFIYILKIKTKNKKTIHDLLLFKSKRIKNVNAFINLNF